MRIVTSIGTDALPAPDGDEALLDGTAASLAELVRAGHEVVVTHGGSPDSQAATGSRFVRALADLLPGRTVVALVTHTEVGAHDPAPRGPGSSPLRPRAVLEAPVIRELLADGTVVVCAGGGGLPVVRERGTSRLRAVAGAADPEPAAALLAVELDADALLFLTRATHLFAARSHGRPRPLLHLTPAELAAEGLPEAVRGRAAVAADFVTRTGGFAGVGPADNALGILNGTTGTVIRTGDAPVRTVR